MRTAASEAEVKAAVESTTSSTSSSLPSLLLIDFFANWCGPCKRIAPVLDKLSEKLKDEVAFLKVDVDALPQVAAQFDVKAMPTFKLVRKGKVVGEVVGADEGTLRSLLHRHVTAAAVDDFIDQWLRAWTGGDASSLLRFYSDDCVYSDPLARKGLKGRGELAAYLSKLLAANPRWEWRRVRTWIAEEDDAFFFRWKARIPVGGGQDGEEEEVVEEEGADVVHVLPNPRFRRTGTDKALDEPRFLISRNDVFFDRTRWLAAAAKRKQQKRPEPAKL